MVYARSWISFVKQSHDIAQAEPDKTRFSIKWRHTTGQMVLKVTDDKHCLKYKTSSSIILNRFEIFVNEFLARQQNRPIVKPEPPKKVVAEKTSTPQVPSSTATAANASKAAATAKDAGKAATTSGGGTSSSKNKKKGKKK